MHLFDFFWLLSPLQPTITNQSLHLPRKPFFPIDCLLAGYVRCLLCWKSDPILKYFAALDIKRDFLKTAFLEKYSGYGKIYIRKENVLASFTYGEFSCVQ